ncbi:MAG TPA: 2-dehydropantoate 2-reductase [Streptosporangiaceae bacterium]|jgi:2-dehydropantoate 2-reductase
MSSESVPADEPSTVAIVGAGAIGGVLADAVSRAGHEVVLCVRTPVPSLTVGRDGAEREVPATVVADPAGLAGPVDWVLVTTKGHQTAGAFPWLRRLAGPGTPVVAVQNGVDHVRRLAGASLPGPVLPALAWIWARREEPGRVAHAGGHRLIVPEVPVGRAFANLLAGGPIDVELSADFVTDAWRKLLTNVAASPITALTGRTMEVLHSPGIGSLVRGLLAEAVAAGNAAGAHLTDADVAATLDWYQSLAGARGTSMLEDRRAGRPTEHDDITGAVVRAADRHGVDVPLNRAVLALLTATSPAA